MLNTLKNAWGIPELRKKLIFTVLIMLLYRIGNVIPVPFINVSALTNYYDTVLSNGTLTKKITVKAAAFSESAKEKIEQAGGKAEVV